MNDLLRSNRLILEPLVAAHAERLHARLADPALYPFLPRDPLATVAELRARFERLERRTSPDGAQRWLNWAARLIDTSDGTGDAVDPEAPSPELADPEAYVGLFEATVEPDRSASIAYFMFTSSQRRGLGTHGAGLVVAHLFASGVDTVRATIDSRNLASQRLVEKLGFTRERFIENADHFRGSPSHEYVYRRDRGHHDG